MTRSNMESITGRPWPGGDINKWLCPMTMAGPMPRSRRAMRRSGPRRHVWARPFGALQGQQLHLPRRSDRVQCSLQRAARFRPRADAAMTPHRAVNCSFRLHRGDASALPDRQALPAGDLPLALKVQINAVAKDAAGRVDPDEFGTPGPAVPLRPSTLSRRIGISGLMSGCRSGAATRWSVRPRGSTRRRSGQAADAQARTASRSLRISQISNPQTPANGTTSAAPATDR